MITRSEPIFPVRDLEATIAYYRDVLGGENDWQYGDPPGFGGIHLGGKQILFERRSDPDDIPAGLSHMLFCEDLEHRHERHLANAAHIVEPIGDRPWGYREYVVEDPNGVRLRFCGLPSYEKPPTAAEQLPESIAIEDRLPTAEEYQTLRDAVGWTLTSEGTLDPAANAHGVVAVERASGQTVGMARAVEDAPGWCSIWDVVVHPDHQAQRIGSALMESLLERLRQTYPSGTKVYLFTFSHGFYERLGFETQTCSMLSL